MREIGGIETEDGGFEDAIAVDTREVVGRWWVHRRRSSGASVPGGLSEDIQAARLAFDDGLQARLWEQHLFLSRSEQDERAPELLGLDPWDVLFDLRERRAETMATATEAVEHGELIAALKERARGGRGWFGRASGAGRDAASATLPEDEAACVPSSMTRVHA